MLNTVFKDALINREKTLSILKGPDYEKIIQKAKENWIDYEPQKKDVISAGIDSSFNSTKFQGAELWAVTAVSIKSDGEIIADLHDFGLDTNPVLASLASKMEIDACNMSIDNADLVLMDGSLYSQFMTRQASLTESMINAMKKRNNVVFVSKTSNTRKQFEDLGAIAGDIFYYNHASRTPGFSKIFEDKKFASLFKSITVENKKQNNPAIATVVNLGVCFLHLRLTEKIEKPSADTNPKIRPIKEFSPVLP